MACYIEIGPDLGLISLLYYCFRIEPELNLPLKKRLKMKQQLSISSTCPTAESSQKVVDPKHSSKRSDTEQ